MPLLAVGALAVLAACGGSDDAGKPASTDQSSTPPAVALTQADFAPKVLAALKAKGTFRTVTVTTDEEGPATFTTDVKISDAGTDVSGSGDGSAVLRVGGQLYGKGDGISDDPAKWVKYDPTATGSIPELTGALIKILAAQAVTHEMIGGAAYATSFNSAPGAAAGTTDYTMTVDLPKAAAAKALGEYITPKVVAAQNLKDVAAKVSLDKDSLPVKLEFQLGTSKVVADFSNYGTPVTIAAPAAGELA